MLIVLLFCISRLKGIANFPLLVCIWDFFLTVIKDGEGIADLLIYQGRRVYCQLNLFGTTINRKGRMVGINYNFACTL